MMEQDNPKIGFKWKLIYRGIAGFAWELVPNPDAVGTVAKPLSGLRESVLLWGTTIPTALTLRLPLLTVFLQPLKTKGFWSSCNCLTNATIYAIIKT